MTRLRCLANCVVALLSLIASACASSPSAPTFMGPFVVVGLVQDFRTNAAVPGVTVSFGDLRSATVIPSDPRSVTDSSGSYQLALMPGQYHVWVDNAYRGLARVRSGVNRTDLIVHDGGCTALYGTIADTSTGRPLAGASVSIVGVTGTSGSDGAYRLDLGCRGFFAFTGSICLLVTRAGYQDECPPMGRGENLVEVLRQDVDLAPR